MNVLEVKGLSKSYMYKGDLVEAVKNVSFNIRKGEIFGLLGPNGAGKSTTINILSGVLSKDSGSIKVFGKDIDTESEFIKNNMNVASAYFGLSDVLTIGQNLKVYAKIFGVKNVDNKIDSLLKDFELSHLKNKKVNSLSSGERTRLAVCKGLLNDPKLLLLDEATVGLDPDVAEKTRNFIKDYVSGSDNSILFTSHYMFEVEELCKRIGFMSKGELIKVDSAHNLKNMIKKQTIEMHFLKENPKLRKFFSDRNIDVYFIGEGKLSFEIRSDKKMFLNLLKDVFKEGLKLQDLHIKKPTLEDTFIKISRGRK